MYLKNNRGFSETSFNVCPKITFTKNNKGYIQRSDPKLLYFDWQFDENIIVIRHTKNKDTDDVIDDGNYKIIQPNNKVYSEIDLLDTVKGIKYILGR